MARRTGARRCTNDIIAMQHVLKNGYHSYAMCEVCDDLTMFDNINTYHVTANQYHTWSASVYN